MPNNDIALMKAMTAAINIIATRIIGRISQGNYPSDPEKMSVEVAPVEMQGTVAVGTIKIKGATVFAYEFGSGLWAERGERAKYPITPTNASILAFKWPEASYAAAFDEEGNELVIPGEDGQVFLPSVMHPGIRAQPFVEPAIRETEQEVIELLGDEFLLQVSTALGPDEIVI